MKGLPPYDISIIRQLHGQGEAVGTIAGMMRIADATVREIIDKLGPQTAEEAKAEGEAWEAAEAKRAARRQAKRVDGVNTTKDGR